MSELPECLERRGNGQVCHRIEGHGGNCMFDPLRQYEVEPEEALSFSSLPVEYVGGRTAYAARFHVRATPNG